VSKCEYCGLEIQPASLAAHRCAQMNQHGVCGWNNMPRDVKLLIGSYLPIQDLGKLATVDSVTAGSPALAAINREYWDKGSGKSGTFQNAQKKRRTDRETIPYHKWNPVAQSAWSEMRTARALHTIYRQNFCSWNGLSEAEQKQYRDNWKLESGGTPDYILNGMPADSFVVKVPGLGFIDDVMRLKANALTAVHNSLRTNMETKWKKYSKGGSPVVAVADISDFPQNIDTQEVVNLILQDQKIKEIATLYPNCILLLLRECTVTQIKF